MTAFPDKPSDLIELALGDLIKCERSPKYSIDMMHFHDPEIEEDVCIVCLAGAVMAQTLGANIKNYYSSLDFIEEDALDALNALRTGRCGAAFHYLGLDRDAGYKFDQNITDYSISPNKFKRGMRKLARDLRAGGY